MATRNLTMQLKTPDNTPLVGAKITVRPNRALPVTDGVILATTITAESDENGRATVSLIPSPEKTNYTISITPGGFMPLTFTMPDRNITLTQLVSERLAQEDDTEAGQTGGGGSTLVLVPSVTSSFITLPTTRMTAPSGSQWGPWFEPIQYTNNANGARLVTITGSLNFKPNWSVSVGARVEVVLVISHRRPNGDKVGPAGAYADFLSFKDIPYIRNIGETASIPFVFTAHLAVGEYILGESRFRSQFPNNAGTVSVVDGPCQAIVYANL